MLAFFTGLVAYYDCWIRNTAGVADMDIRKVLCTKGTVTDNLHHRLRVSVAKPMADYVGDYTLRYRDPFTNPSPEYIARNVPMRARNPCKIDDDKKMSFSCISNGRDLEVGQQVVVSFENLPDIYKIIDYRPQLYTHNYNNGAGEHKFVRGKIAKVIPSDGTHDDTMYKVEFYAGSNNPNPSGVELTTSDPIDGMRVRAFHDSAVVAHVGDRNVLSDVKLACVHCQEMRAMEGFEFCGACGKR
ncbi:hypothetical protein ScalyP_jg2211 [Parmales sp. scaly parma]|nr:hypothetical protein ScalyP_jg2211 [Parmales sp. scaly parma]